MRKLYVLTAATVATACLASPAMAAGDPIKTLSKKVAALQSQVKALRADLADAQSTLDCLGPLAPVARFGGVFNGVPEGYIYGVGQQEFLTTGLDLINPSGLTPGRDYAQMMTWAPGCASEPPALYRTQLRSLPVHIAGRVLTRIAW